MAGGPVAPGQKVYHSKNRRKAKSTKKRKAQPSGFGGLSGIGEGANLAEAIEAQAATQKRIAEEKAMASNPALTDPFSALQQQLFGAVNGINVSATPLEELRRMAESQIAAQFDPQIDALKAEMGMRANRANRSQGQAREMYGALSKDYLSQLPALTQQFAAEDQAANARYDQAQAQMNAEYQKNAQQQDAVLKQLGIQAAAPDASQQAMDDRAYFQNQMEMDQQQNLAALNEQQVAQQDYTRNLGNTAKMAGENLAQDIAAQLEDYMGAANSQMTSLQGQRGSALAALVAQLQSQDQERVAAQRQQEFDNMLKLYNFQLDATNSALKNQPAAAGTGFGADGTLTTGLAGAQNYLASVYPDQPILASGLMEQLNDVLSNKAVTQGKFVLEPGDPALGKSPKYSDVGQEYMMDLLRREFEKEGDRYGTGDINATINALLAYLGKLR